MGIPLTDLPRFESGDPNRFALFLEFVDNLDPGGAAPDEDLSWGRLQIWVGGCNLCRHIDSKDVIESVDWYFLPLLEWFADSWDALFHEQRLPGENSGYSAWQSLRVTHSPWRLMRTGDWDSEAADIQTGWAERHSLRTARYGGLFPDVVIRRYLDEVEISWGNSAIAGMPQGFSFLAPAGFERLNPEEVSSVIYCLLRQATDALLAMSPSSPRLQHLMADVDGLQMPERIGSRVALLAGLGNTLERSKFAWDQLIRSLTTKLGPEKGPLGDWFLPANTNPLVVYGTAEAAVMFGAAAPTLDEQDVLNIATRLLETAQPQNPSITLPERAEALDPELPPWEDGYQLAEKWLATANLPRTPTGAIDIEKHLELLGVKVGPIELNDARTAGLAIIPVKGTPYIFYNQHHSKCKWLSGRRFVMAHELCHLLHDRSKGRNLALISGPWAPRDLEKRANAFAAALLMPPQEIRAEWARDAKFGSVDSVLALAQKYQVSPNALVHHLKNFDLIDESTEEDLRAQLLNDVEVMPRDQVRVVMDE